jgi:hypothetical protein
MNTPSFCSTQLPARLLAVASVLEGGRLSLPYAICADSAYNFPRENK